MAGPTNPFLENDFTKIFSEFKIPGFDMQALVATQRRNIEAVSHARKGTRDLSNRLAGGAAQQTRAGSIEVRRRLAEQWDGAKEPV